MKGEIVLENNLVATIYEAIDNYQMIKMEIHTGSFGANISFYPEGVDEGSNNIIIYSDENIYVIDTTNVSWDELEDRYICTNDNCIVSISMEY